MRPGKGVVPVIQIPYIVGNIKVEVFRALWVLESKHNRRPLSWRICLVAEENGSTSSTLEALIMAPMQAASKQLAREMCMLRRKLFQAWWQMSEIWRGKNTPTALDDGHARKDSNFYNES
jgi:hypothetical protein